MSEESKKESVGYARPNMVSRRRLVRAGFMATPVILATSGRSALASGGSFSQGLSPMAWLSANPGGVPGTAVVSHHVGQNALGFSPGYWRPNKEGKTFQGAWPQGCNPFHKITANTCGAIYWRPYDWNSYSDLPYDENHKDVGWNTGSVLNWLNDARSISRILIEDSGGLKWHVCAAYLNALRSEQSGLSGSSAYALTSAEVQQIYISRRLVPGGSTLSDSVLKSFFEQTWS